MDSMILSKSKLFYDSMIKLVKHNFPLVKPGLLLLITCLSFMCLEKNSRISCSITYPGIKMNLIVLQFPGSSFLPFLKMSDIFFILSSSPLTPLQEPSTVIESCLIMTSASYLRTRGCTSSGPVHYYP